MRKFSGPFELKKYWQPLKLPEEIMAVMVILWAAATQLHTAESTKGTKIPS